MLAAASLISVRRRESYLLTVIVVISRSLSFAIIGRSLSFAVISHPLSTGTGSRFLRHRWQIPSHFGLAPFRNRQPNRACLNCSETTLHHNVCVYGRLDDACVSIGVGFGINRRWPQAKHRVRGHTNKKQGSHSSVFLQRSWISGLS